MNVSKKVLVVDDSAVIRMQVGALLMSAGYQVVEAVDGYAGAQQMEQDPSIAMIICDVNMPNMNGIDMVARIKADAKNQALPIVMLTSEAQPALVERAKKAGAKGWIVKPFKNELLLAAVHKLIGR